MKTTSQKKVLHYLKGRKNQATVKRHYLQWRAEQNPPIPLRCDNPICVFHTEPLVWNDKELKPILDHINGVSGDNRPQNLQLLCPNCNSQQSTHGGGNKGKVEQLEGGFMKIDEDGKRHFTLPVETGHLKLKGNKANVKNVKEED